VLTGRIAPSGTDDTHLQERV